MNKPRKFTIVRRPTSLTGFAMNEVKQGGHTVTTLTQFKLFKNIETNDVTLYKSIINSYIADVAFPIVIESFSGKKIPNKFFLGSLYVEMFGDETKNKILINNDAEISAVCELKSKKKFKKNEPVKNSDIKYFTNLERKDGDPNAATILLAQHNNEWFGIFDLIYNRKYVKDKVERAIEFFNTATDSLKNKNYWPFYQNLWDCAELLIECVLLLHNLIKIKTPHDKIKKSFKPFCKSNNINYDKIFEEVAEIRNNSRYGPPHPPNKSFKEYANYYHFKTAEFLSFVLSFLENRQVSPSENSIKKINLSKIDQD